MSPRHPLLVALRRELRRAADPERAAKQQAYMKSTMPFHGVANGAMRTIARAVFADYAFDDPDRWRADVLAIWHGAAFREERYAAIELAQRPKAKAFHRMDALPMFEDLIVSGAWWDEPTFGRLCRVLFSTRLSSTRSRRTISGSCSGTRPGRCAARYSRGAGRTISGSAAAPSSVSWASRRRPTSTSCTRVSRRRSVVRSSSSARRSAGRCGSMRRPTRRPCDGTCARTRPSSLRSRSARR